MTYELLDYVAMLRDRGRTPAYLAAMREVIRPGQVVLEIGTGPGFFAVHAALMGARHVYAVEPNDAIGFGPRLAAEHGVSDRITFLQKFSTAATLPERADVLIEDLRGIFPLLSAHLPAVRDARARLLVPGAKQIAVRDRLYFAPSEVTSDVSVLAPELSRVVDGLDISTVLEGVRGGWCRTRTSAEALLAPGAEWATLEYTTLESDDVVGVASWVTERAGCFAGYQSWFKAELTERVSYETGPTAGRTVYDAGFFPLAEPVSVAAGERVEVRIRAKFDGTDYVWGWDTTIRPLVGAPKRFRQSSLKGRLLSSTRRARRSADHAPTRSPSVAVLATVLAAVDGTRTLAAIVDRVLDVHPTVFSSRVDALRWTAERLALLDEDAAL